VKLAYVCAITGLLAVGCAKPPTGPKVERLAPEGRSSYVVTAITGGWRASAEMVPWSGGADPSDVVAYGFIDRGDASDVGGMNPSPRSFRLSYQGARIPVPYAMYSDLFYLRTLSIEKTSDGCVVHLDGAEAGGRYFGKIIVSSVSSDQGTPHRYFATRRVLWTRGGEDYRSEIRW